MSEFRPGKGIHMTLDFDTLEFIRLAVEEIWNAAPDDEDPTKTILEDLRGSATGWTLTKDNFGTKLYKVNEIDDANQLRITVVVNKAGEVKLDIRTWFDPSAV